MQGPPIDMRCTACGGHSFLVQRIARFEVDSLQGGRCECGRAAGRVGEDFEDLAWRREARIVRRLLDEGRLDDGGTVQWEVLGMELESEVIEAREQTWCQDCAEDPSLVEESPDDSLDTEHPDGVTVDVRCARCRTPFLGPLVLGADKVIPLPHE